MTQLFLRLETLFFIFSDAGFMLLSQDDDMRGVRGALTRQQHTEDDDEERRALLT